MDSKHIQTLWQIMEQLREAEELDEAQTFEKDNILERAEEIKEAREKKRKKAAATEEGVTEELFRAGVESLYYRLKKFRRRFAVGVALEVILAIAAVVAFILTENMRLPMTLIDRWTPLMILLLLITWIIDVTLIRYRDEVEADKKAEEAEKQKK